MLALLWLAAAVSMCLQPGETVASPPFLRTDIFQPTFHQAQRYRDTRSVKVRSPAVEVVMHLPPQFRDVDQFKRYLGVPLDPDRLKRNALEKSIVDVRSYEVSQYTPFDRRKRQNRLRSKREASVPQPETVAKSLKIENEPVERKYLPETIIELPELITGPVYTAYPGASNLELTSDYDLDELRKRRASANDDEESNQREKRTFMESGGEKKESTTTPSYWTRNKPSPPFITGREGRNNNQNTYTPPQHRSMDSGARESHSLKDLDKSVQSNEIPRSAHDSYYASTNRRTYNSRQAENFTPAPPKSVYDTLEASGRKEGRNGFARTADGESPERSRQVYEPLPTPRNPYYRTQDRYIYPYPGEVVGRGVEYYHRNWDPASGRIVYYANLPDSGRSYYDSVSRSYYPNGRAYYYDAYGRSYVPPYDYRPLDAYGRPLDYLKEGRSGPDPYSGYQAGEKIPRDARYNSDRFHDEFKNKTYVIYDAEDSTRSSSYPRSTYLDVNRYPTGYSNLPPTPVVPTPYQPAYPSYSSYTGYRSPYYPTQTPWSSRPLVGYSEPVRTYKMATIEPTRSSVYDKIKRS